MDMGTEILRIVVQRKDIGIVVGRIRRGISHPSHSWSLTHSLEYLVKLRVFVDDLPQENDLLYSLRYV